MIDDETDLARVTAERDHAMRTITTLLATVGAIHDAVVAAQRVDPRTADRVHALCKRALAESAWVTRGEVPG